MNRAFEAALKSSARSEQIWRAVKGNYYLLSAELSIERTSVQASAGRFCVHYRMHLLKELDFGTRKHLEKQRGFLLRLHQAELAKDPGSRATESSRSNLMAMRHTVKQTYGEAVARDVARVVTRTQI